MTPLEEREELSRRDLAVLREWTERKKHRDALEPRVLTLVGTHTAAATRVAIPTAGEIESLATIVTDMAALWEQHESLQGRIIERNAYLPKASR